MLFEAYVKGVSPPVLAPIAATESSCIAYGFNWDAETNSCFLLINPKENLIRQKNDLTANLIISGSPDSIGSSTPFIGFQVRRNILGGTESLALGYNKNNISYGDNNILNKYVNNSILTGTKAEATVSNSTVLGGNNYDTDKIGERQNITVMFGTATTNSTVSDSYLNNTVGSYFKVPEDTILAFQSETVVVRTGGTGGGSVGDFKAFIETGAVINNAGVLTIDKSRSTIANTGTTSGWICDLTVSGTNLVQTVKGSNNRNLKWATTIRLTQLKL